MTPQEQLEKWLSDGTLTWRQVRAALQGHARKAIGGDVRDLAEGVIGRAFSTMELTVSELEVANRRGYYARESGGSPQGERVRSPSNLCEMEQELLRLALVQTSGNREKAAEILGVGERTVYRMIHKYKLERVGNE